jgi:hypothetical protein
MHIYRWTPTRKAQLVDALANGEISFAQARREYSLSPEEVAEWQSAMAARGTPGLRTTRLQCYNPERRKR